MIDLVEDDDESWMGIRNLNLKSRISNRPQVKREEMR